MATKPFRFVFEIHKPTSKRLVSVNYNVPLTLIQSDYEDIEKDLNYIARLTIPFMVHLKQSHTRDLVRISDKKCAYCIKPTINILKRHYNFCHWVNDELLIRTEAVPWCGDMECEMMFRHWAFEIHKKDVEDGLFPKGVDTKTEACRVCGTFEDTKLCSGCGMVAYCGKDHQKQDWKEVHKTVCKKWKDGKREL